MIEEVVSTEPGRSGISTKTGNPWKLTKLVTTSGKKATSFDPIEVGDQVELSNYNEQYKNYTAKKVEDVRGDTTATWAETNSVGNTKQVQAIDTVTLKGLETIAGQLDRIEQKLDKILEPIIVYEKQAINANKFSKSEFEDIPIEEQFEDIPIEEQDDELQI